MRKTSFKAGRQVANDPARALYEEIHRRTGKPISAVDGVKLLEQTLWRRPGAKRKAGVQAFVRGFLSQLEVAALDAALVGRLLRALTPSHISEGLRDPVRALVRDAVPPLAQGSEELDAGVIAMILRALGRLSLDDETKGVLQPFLAASYARVEVLMEALTADQTAACVAALRLTPDRGTRATMASGLLSRACATASDMEPGAAAEICAAARALNLDEEGRALARRWLTTSLPELVGQIEDFTLAELGEVMDTIGEQSLAEDEVAPFVAAAIAFVIPREERVRPAELARLVHPLGEVRLDAAGEQQVAALLGTALPRSIDRLAPLEMKKVAAMLEARPALKELYALPQ